MAKVMKVLAIAALLVTIAGAGVLLYAVNSLSPVIVQTRMVATPAWQAQDVFDAAMAQLTNETFKGRVFGDAAGISEQDCTFLTYTVRLQNKGFFPAEWVSLDVHPQEGDICQLDNYSANVLGSRMQGDIAATLLTCSVAAKTQRGYTVTCYVLGRKIVLEGTFQ